MFNVVTAAVGWTKRAAVFAGAGLAVLGAASAAAASPGCDAINQIWGGGVTLSNGAELYEPWPLPPMKAGDKVVYAASTTGSANTHVPNGGGFALYRDLGGDQYDILFEEHASVGAEVVANSTYTLAADESGFIVYGWSGSGGATLRATVTCTPAPAAPTITGLTPGSGPTEGGESVVITGTDFTGATAVSFGGVAASSFTVNSATRITATTPASPAGSVPVSIVNPQGMNMPSGAAIYTYIQRPATPGLISAPPLISKSSTATFGFSLSPGDGLQVSLDGAAFTSASSPLSFAGLAEGTHVLRYKAVALNVESATASYTWTVDTVPPPAPVVTAPTSGATIANPVTFSGTAQTGGSVNLFLNSAPLGATTVSPAGDWSFTPVIPLTSGVYVLTVQATDAAGNLSPMSSGVSFTIPAPALPPTAGPATVIASYGQATTFNLAPEIGGDYDSVQLVTGPTSGTLTLMSDGRGVYTPNSGYWGPDSFTYRATGPGGVSAPATVTLTVGAPAAPVASSVNVTAPFDSSGHAIDLSTSITGVHASLAVVTLPAHGTVSVSGDVVTYTPASGYHGADSFTYTATGPGGTSAPATVSLTVVAPTAPDIDPPAPVVVQPGPDGTSTVALPPAVSGVVTGYRVDSAPAHGQVVVQAPSGGAGWSLAYTPAPGFMGEDTLAVVAQGPGGESAPATMTFRVLGQAPDLQGVSLSGQNVVFEPTTRLTGGPFRGLVITRQPTSGTARVVGLTIIYTPAAPSAGPAARRMAMAASPSAAPASLDYAVILPFGQSLPGTIEVQAVATPTLTALTATTLAGRPVTVSLTDTATGGPFVGATVVGVSNQAGTAALTEGGVAGNRTYDVTFTPEGDFTGTASVTYTLSNAGGPTTGVLTVTVEARSDPSLDPEVRGLVSAQADTARRFARSQADNFHRRLEQVRRGGGAGLSNQMRLNLGDGGLNQDPREALRQQLGQSPSDRDDGFDRPPSARTPADEAAARQADAGQAGQPAKGGLGVWTAGAVDWGRRDAQGQRDYRFSTSGVSAGVDMAMSDRWVAGVGLGYGHDRTKAGDNGTLSEADSYVGAMYGSWRATDDLIVDGVLGYGSLAFDSRRWSADAGEFAFGERSGSVLFGSASVALERSAAGLAWAPYARLQFGKVDLDGFTENGAGVFALKYDAMTVDTLATALGASFDWTLQRRSGLLTPSLRVEWRHEFEGADDQTVFYADWLASPDYMVGLEHWARDSLSLSLGVEWQAVSGWSYGADYNGQAGSDLISHGLKLRLSKAF
ncbi:autotransporter domain-containing protein [Brevundimonas bullata]|uniref:autotransporter domain-containing protein n=1 Tax=Brevundimonas bullata TaxID=13160 RepID=UPI003D9A3B60